MDIASTFDREPFRHTDPKYKCLCGLSHVKKGTMYIAAACATIVSIFLIGILLDFEDQTWTCIIASSLVFAVTIAAVFLIFLAKKKENEKFLLPFLALMVLYMVVAVAVVICGIWSLIDPESGPFKGTILHPTNGTLAGDADESLSHHTGQTVTSAFFIVASLIIVALAIWFIFVVYKYYIYIKDMKNARNPQNVVYHEVNTLKREVKQ
ncbi:unnamed protein product [Auanema sp. JU1783]|nr:unnamed protein product [Auanema sp. JU1783]